MTTTVFVTTADRPALAEQGKQALLPGSPEFIFHAQVSDRLIDRAGEHFPQFDVRLLADGEIIAGAWAVALRWDGAGDCLPAGYDGALIRAITEHESAVAPDTLCAMAASVRGDQQGAGLGARLLSELRARAEGAGLERVIAPVRPGL